MPAHTIETSSGASEHTATCSCGWHVTSVISAGQITARCRIHLAERLAAAAIDRANEQQELAGQRLAALAIARRQALQGRDAARARSADVRRRRRALTSPEAAVGRREADVLERARVLAGISRDELWLAYFSLGGTSTSGDLVDMLAGERPLRPLDHDIVAVVLNEHFDESGFGQPIDYALGHQEAP